MTQLVMPWSHDIERKSKIVEPLSNVGHHWDHHWDDQQSEVFYWIVED